MLVPFSKCPLDKVYKTVFATQGRLLYGRGLPAIQQAIVYEAQSKGLLNYRLCDQIKAVIEILNLIAAYAPISNVTRFINSFKKVTLPSPQE